MFAKYQKFVSRSSVATDPVDSSFHSADPVYSAGADQVDTSTHSFLNMSSAAQENPAVEYNWLGPNSGIKVSNICLGTMTFGRATSVSDFYFPGNTDTAESHAILDRYYELGGNFIDTANIYTGGASEEIVGSWLSKHDRSSIILATKVRFAPEFGEGKGPNDVGLSRGSIMTNLERSLSRLQTDYIDVYYAHGWDAGVKLEETLRAFNDVVTSGKVRYIGVSNVTGAQLQKIVDYNKFMGFNPIVTLQQEYNLLERNSDIEVVPTCSQEGVTLIPYSPLKGGLLTGKLKRDDSDVTETLAGTRLGWAAEKPAERVSTVAPDVAEYRNNEKFWKLMDAMRLIGLEHGKTQAQVALRWLLQKDYVAAVVIGARTVKQLEDSMGAGTGWRLTDEQMSELDDLSLFSGLPGYPYQFINAINRDRTRL